MNEAVSPPPQASHILDAIRSREPTTKHERAFLAALTGLLANPVCPIGREPADVISAARAYADEAVRMAV